MLETTVTTDAELTLAADFAPPTRDDWLALVDKVLKGAPFEKRLVSRTYDGIEIQPLYTRGAAPVAELPGQPLYTRGRRAEGAVDGAWGIRQVHAHPDPAAANRQILEDLERGATSLTLRLDVGGAGEVDGIVVADVDDLDRALAGVHLEMVTIVLEAGAAFAEAADLLVALWDRRGTAADQRQANLGADPLGTLARTGRLPQGLDAALDRVAELARSTVALPHVRAVEIDTSPAADAGASEAQELAFALADGVAVLRALTAADCTVDEAAAQIGFTLSVDADVFASVAKLRAARRLWAHVVTTSGGGADAAAAPVSARTSWRMMSRRDPWVNLLRTTAACFAAGVAGASSVTVLPFDEALGLPSELGRRLSRNTQLLLQEESHVGRVTDPAGGSWYVETLTDQLCEAAWAAFQQIEAAGGLAAALADGSLAAAVGDVRDARAANIARRKDPLTGVSEFPNLGEELPVPPTVDRAALRAAANGRGPVAPHGPATEVTPLGAHRLAEEFEALRDASDAHLAAMGTRPRVFLANLGPVAAHTARATFAKNFFEAGGIEALGNDGFADADALGTAFAASGARLAVICGSDGQYETEAAPAAAALKAAGAARVYLAGNPGDRRAADTAAGVDEFVHLGVDVLATLRTAHDLLEVAK